MKSAYFDHETEVKYTENVLNKSRDWSWLIEYIEENFEFDFEIDAVSKFYPLFSKIEQLFNYLKSINELADEVNISCQWLIDINQMVLFSLGKRELKELDLKNDFLRLLALYILSAKLANEKSLLKYLIYSEIFQFDNIFNLLCVDGFIEEKDTIEAIINSLDLDFSFEKEKAQKGYLRR